jgi:hypothetical protein
MRALMNTTLYNRVDSSVKDQRSRSAVRASASSVSKRRRVHACPQNGREERAVNTSDAGCFVGPKASLY